MSNLEYALLAIGAIVCILGVASQFSGRSVALTPSVPAPLPKLIRDVRQQAEDMAGAKIVDQLATAMAAQQIEQFKSLVAGPAAPKAPGP